MKYEIFRFAQDDKTAFCKNLKSFFLFIPSPPTGRRGEGRVGIKENSGGTGFPACVAQAKACGYPER
jgi:hypothetical protein